LPPSWDGPGCFQELGSVTPQIYSSRYSASCWVRRQPG
jgi:hypothetical protein